MDAFNQIASKIIKEQELIIGPVAWSQAQKVSGITIIDMKIGTVSVQDENGQIIIDQLVSQYEHLFGRASREVCKEAAATLIADLSPSEVPSSLR